MALIAERQENENYEIAQAGPGCSGSDGYQISSLYCLPQGVDPPDNFSGDGCSDGSVVSVLSLISCSWGLRPFPISQLRLLRSIFRKKNSTAETSTNPDRVSTITSDDLVLPYPNTPLTKALDIKAHNSPPPFSSPVTCASPIGNDSQHPRSQQMGITGVTTKPITDSTIEVTTLMLAVLIHRQSSSSMTVEPIDATRRAREQLEVRLRQRLKRIAPTVPKTMSKTPLTAIYMSLQSQGFMMKLELAPKVIKVPYPKQQPGKNFHKFLSCLIWRKVYLMEDSL